MFRGHQGLLSLIGELFNPMNQYLQLLSFNKLDKLLAKTKINKSIHQIKERRFKIQLIKRKTVIKQQKLLKPFCKCKIIFLILIILCQKSYLATTQLQFLNFLNNFFRKQAISFKGFLFMLIIPQKIHLENQIWRQKIKIDKIIKYQVIIKLIKNNSIKISKRILQLHTNNN